MTDQSPRTMPSSEQRLSASHQVAADGPPEEEAITATAASRGVESSGDRSLLANGVWTVPNALSLVRLACGGVFVWLLFFAHQQIAAGLLLAGLGATDWLDGWIARRFGQVSELGKVLDPSADRILLATAIVSILVYGAAPVWLGVATITRETLVSLAVVVLASLGAKRIDVVWVGKAGTFGLMSAFPAFLLADGTAWWQHDLHVLAWVVAIPALVLAWVAAAAYVPKAREALASRNRRAAG